MRSFGDAQAPNSVDQSEKKTPVKLSISEEAARLAIRELRALTLTKSQIDLKFPAGEAEF